MRITYDPKYNIAYIALREKRAKVKTISLSSEVNVDIASDGELYGIELLNARKQLKTKSKGVGFSVSNISSGERVVVPLGS
ncbi:MAG: DUF2283 domain-containing protein [bacterium]|nr:DUF2283 domain-containing protein [bacterium]MDZ4232063.1 DUF2283 domain-containing protein [Candidatus Pacearchaeota archaeon]